MLQVIDGNEVYVVDLDVMPELPITWNNEQEKPYAQALQSAIKEGLIKEPGKYGLIVSKLTETDLAYNVYAIEE